MTTLSIQNLSLTIDRNRLLDDVSLSIGTGELVGLIGPNGAGKSSLLRAITGNLHGWEGAIDLDGQPLDAVSRQDRAKAIAYLPQTHEGLWPISGRRLVMLGRLPHLGPFSGATDQDYALVEQILRDVDALAFADRPVTHLSGGELARIWLARALAVQAPLLLADEPIAALDPAHQLATMSLFHNAVKQGQGVMVVLHDLGLAARLCDRLVLMDRGKVVADGTPQNVLTADRVAAVYKVRLIRDESGGFSLLPL
ncbi:MAG: ABC transporter ATP-binding protein [Alphaproteobacteria bacterium]